VLAGGALPAGAQNEMAQSQEALLELEPEVSDCPKDSDAVVTEREVGTRDL
jgi:hypothetical protein